MDNKVNNYWLKVLSGSSINDHCVYALSELDKIPEVPGIYAWYLKLDSTNLEDYFKLYKQKRIKVNIEGPLKESYQGSIKSTYNAKDFESPSIDFDLCEIASLAFSPPLYIGISKNLKRRLNEHGDELEDIYFGKTKLSPPTPLRKIDFDTEKESSHFAQRIGTTIKSFRKMKLSSLYIRTIEMPVGYIWNDLQKVEKYLNRTYNPIYGRK
ncbi:hypothetical protein [Desertivirga brevis]|uniref:hypothetical protein n=1 Tax=Desertivirga brevis TaxID=2810310 RepID=UPI001A975CCD|nr:hypothetical protein [Pedobacter sp. SYSU D00873]